MLRVSGLNTSGTHGVFAFSSEDRALSLSFTNRSSFRMPSTSSYRVTNHATCLWGSVVRYTGKSGREDRPQPSARTSRLTAVDTNLTPTQVNTSEHTRSSLREHML